MDVKKVIVYLIVLIAFCAASFFFGRCSQPNGSAAYHQVKSELDAATNTVAKLTKELESAKSELERLGKIETDLSKLYRDFTNANSELERIKAAIGATNTGIVEDCSRLAESVRESIEIVREFERRQYKKLYYYW